MKQDTNHKALRVARQNGFLLHGYNTVVVGSGLSQVRIYPPTIKSLIKKGWLMESGRFPDTGAISYALTELGKAAAEMYGPYPWYGRKGL